MQLSFQKNNNWKQSKSIAKKETIKIDFNFLQNFVKYFVDIIAILHVNEIN